MIRSLFILIGCFCFWVSATAQFTDSFADGNIYSAPVWLGDTGYYEVVSQQLQLDASSSASDAYLTVESEAVGAAVWEFTVEMDFNPSGFNFTEVYLLANRAVVSDTFAGYFVKLGGGNDEVSLYRKDTNRVVKRIDGKDDRLDTGHVRVRIRVERTPSGFWSLFSDTTGTGNWYFQEGVVQDDEYVRSSWFGIACHFTSTRSDKFAFDNFVVSGSPYQDTIPPLPVSAKSEASEFVKVGFDEPVDSLKAGEENRYLLLPDSIVPDSAVVHGNLEEVDLFFSTSLQNATTHRVAFGSFPDTSGNWSLPDTLTFFHFIPDSAVPGEVVFNELMVDPAPKVGLPEVEYIELFNASDKLFSLGGWSVSDGSSTAWLEPYLLRPDSMVVLVDRQVLDSVSDFPNLLVVDGLPTLNNGGERITIRNEAGVIVDEVTYESSWYGEGSPKGDGVSLELVNPYDPCRTRKDWWASSSLTGGTPGRLNSLFDPSLDEEGPSMVAIRAIASDTVLLEFNELLSRSGVDGGDFSGLDIDTAYVKPNGFSLELILVQQLDSGRFYDLRFEGVEDCPGNKGSGETEVILPFLGREGDVVINELLFDPLSGGEDYVELFNRSDRVLDLKDWYLGDEEQVLNPLLEEQLLLLPEEYLLITEDSSATALDYPYGNPNRFLEVDKLVNFPNDSGTVILRNRDSNRIDRMEYHAGMHFELLDDPEGVSLERIDPNIPSTRENWHSASGDKEFGTPGRRNSQYRSDDAFSGNFRLEPEVIVPNQDGRDDFLRILYQMNDPGHVANITIYDSQGRVFRQLVENALLGTEGVFKWDGTGENGRKARLGIHPVVIEVFNAQGEVEYIKKPCVVGRSLE